MSSGSRAVSGVRLSQISPNIHKQTKLLYILLLRIKLLNQESKFKLNLYVKFSTSNHSKITNTTHPIVVWFKTTPILQSKIQRNPQKTTFEGSNTVSNVKLGQNSFGIQNPLKKNPNKTIKSYPKFKTSATGSSFWRQHNLHAADTSGGPDLKRQRPDGADRTELIEIKK